MMDFVQYLLGALFGLWFLVRIVQKSQRSGSGATLILQRFSVDKANTATTLVEISGRAEGLIGWLSSLLKFGADGTLALSRKSISIVECGFMKETTITVPLSSVASTRCAYEKGAGLLIIGVASGLLALRSLFQGLIIEFVPYVFWPVIMVGYQIPWWIYAVISLITFALYQRSTRIVIVVETSGGMQFGLRFRPSIVEGVSIGIAQAKTVIDCINDTASSSLNKRVGSQD